MSSPEKFRISLRRRGDEFERNKVANVVGVGQGSDTGAATLLFGVGLNGVSRRQQGQGPIAEKIPDEELILRRFCTVKRNPPPPRVPRLLFTGV